VARVLAEQEGAGRNLSLGLRMENAHDPDPVPQEPDPEGERSARLCAGCTCSHTLTCKRAAAKEAMHAQHVNLAAMTEGNEDESSPHASVRQS
jgi:hypothetical protein